MEKPLKPPIIRKCACGCRRTFTVAYEWVEKRYFDRHCANNHAKRYHPKRYAGARGTSRVRARKAPTFALCETP